MLLKEEETLLSREASANGGGSGLLWLSMSYLMSLWLRGHAEV